MSEKEKLQVRVEFEGDSLQEVEALKNYYGVQNNSELIRILVKDRVRQLKLGA